MMLHILGFCLSTEMMGFDDVCGRLQVILFACFRFLGWVSYLEKNPVNLFSETFLFLWWMDFYKLHHYVWLLNDQKHVDNSTMSFMYLRKVVKIKSHSLCVRSLWFINWNRSPHRTHIRDPLIPLACLWFHQVGIISKVPLIHLQFTVLVLQAYKSIPH